MFFVDANCAVHHDAQSHAAEILNRDIFLDLGGFDGQR